MFPSSGLPHKKAQREFQVISDRFINTFETSQQSKYFKNIGNQAKASFRMSQNERFQEMKCWTIAIAKPRCSPYIQIFLGLCVFDANVNLLSSVFSDLNNRKRHANIMFVREKIK